MDIQFVFHYSTQWAISFLGGREGGGRGVGYLVCAIPLSVPSGMGLGSFLVFLLSSWKRDGFPCMIHSAREFPPSIESAGNEAQREETK